MSAADARARAEAALWRLVPGITPEAVDAVMAAFDAYARATPKALPPKKPPLPQRPPAVHYAADSGRPACIPFDRVAATGRALTRDPAKVTCGHCRKRQAWSDASALAALEDCVTRDAP